MYEELLKLKIDECYSNNKPLASLLEKRYRKLNITDEVVFELNDFILDNSEVYSSNNLLKLVYEAFLELGDNRFGNFVRNLINGNPKRERTYNHMLNDIKEQLNFKYDMPSSYYSMTREQLDKECDILLEDNKFLLLGRVRKFINENFTISDYKSYVYENRDQARRILRHLKEDETDKTYIRLRNLLRDNPGYLGVFTFFNKIEEIPFQRIKNLYKRIQSNDDILDRLETSVVNYMTRSRTKQSFTAKDGRTYSTHFEKLSDDLTIIEEAQMAKIFSDEYPGSIKRGLNKKEDFIEAIKTLVDDEEKLALYSKFWLKKVSRYKTQQDLIDSLISFVFSDTGVENLRSTINNDSQLKLVFDDGELIVVRVLSYESLSNFAGDTSWCIKDSLSYWMDYIGNDNIQLVIINAEMPATSVEGKIGLTIYDGGRYNTAHRRNDSYIGEKELNQYLGNYGLSITELYDLSRGIGSNEYYSQDEISDDNYGGYNF